MKCVYVPEIMIGKVLIDTPFGEEAIEFNYDGRVGMIPAFGNKEDAEKAYPDCRIRTFEVLDD